MTDAAEDLRADYEREQLDLAEAEVRVRCAFFAAAQWLAEHGRLPTVMELLSIEPCGVRIALYLVMMHDLEHELDFPDDEPEETDTDV